MLALGLIISYEPFEQIIMLMADIRRNQMIFWMSLAGLEAFIIIIQNDLNIFGFVCSRRKYERTDITFKSIADLRRELPAQAQDTVSTIQLIKSFVERMRKENENADLVTFFVLNIFKVVILIHFRFW